MSFLFDSKGDAQAERAYTHVDFAHARVGNRWIHREWSRFMGMTVSVLQKPCGTEWVAARNPDFSIVANGQALGLEDFGEVDYSEECNVLGATLVLVHSRPGLEVMVENMALHNAPALVRSVTLHNTGREPLKLSDVTTEALHLESESVETRGQEIVLEDRIEGNGHASRITTLSMGSQHLIIFLESSGKSKILQPEPRQLLIRETQGNTLDPGTRLALQRTILITVEGEPELAAQGLIVDVRRLLHEQESLEAKQALDMESE